MEESEEAASFLIRGWAGTSGDNNVQSIAMQLAAQKEFALKGTSLWWDKTALNQAKNFLKIDKGKYEVAMRRFLREMYNDTQKHLAKQGLKTIRVARGYKGDIGIAPSTINNPMSITKIKLQPMSSFSADMGTAEKFTLKGYGDRSLIFCEAPVDRILSCPVTGFGCKDEFEYVILGSQNIKGEKAVASLIGKDRDISWGQLFFGILDDPNEGRTQTISRKIFKVTK